MVPCRRLGIPSDASFEEVQDARNFLFDVSYTFSLQLQKRFVLSMSPSAAVILLLQSHESQGNQNFPLRRELLCLAAPRLS